MICLNVYFSLSNVSLYFTSSIIEWNSCEKLWEIRQQEYLLTIAYHINRICRKASQKLHALFGTAKKIPEDKKCILFKFSIISRLTKNVSFYAVFVSNIMQIWVSQSTSIPPEIFGRFSDSSKGIRSHWIRLTLLIAGKQI